MRTDEALRLKLVTVQGQPLDPVRLDPGGAAVLGRSATCDVQLPDPSVSRRHATVAFQGGTWFVTDLASRAGVQLNGLALPRDTPSPLGDLDLLTIGPWTFRVHLGVGSSTFQTISVGPDRLDPGERVDAVPDRELRSLASRRLDLLIDCAARINAATGEQALALAIVEAAREGTGFPRAAMIRRTADEIAVLAETGERGPEAGTFSCTLLDAAAAGQVARLSHDAPAMHGESIARLGIQAALCAPIFVGQAIDAFLYLDDRRHRADVRPDAAAFCQALCRIGGLALANRRRAALERANAEIMREVGAAAEAQRLLMPRPDGVCGGVRYSVRMRPGRFVAGDLFNILTLDGGRVGVYLGDVAGKGVGAAILMAAMQTMLNAALRTTEGPAEALHRVGREIAPMLPGGRFVSLWVGLLEPGGLIRFVDAGHGHWLVRDRAESEPRRASAVGGLPLGVDPDAPYRDETIRVEPGGRIILLSDGVLEQRSRDGEEFGLGRTVATLLDCASAREDVERLFGAVARHAPTEALDDDVTIASIELPEN